MKRLKIRGYVDIPDNMSAEEFYGEINGAEMFINDHDIDTFTLYLGNYEEPSADVAEVKHGEWLEENKRPKSEIFICTNCGGTAYFPQPTRLKDWEKHCPYKYCPNCGAKMDGEGSNGND